MVQIKFPLSRPDLTIAEVQAVTEVLESRFLSLGPRLPEFERAFAALIGASYAVGVSSGTAGLHLALLVLGIGPGEEVITSPFSFIASANCIRYVGATPVFADIDPATLNLDPARAAARVTPRTRALLPVHAFGNPCDLEALSGLARLHGLQVVEDACEALGASCGRQPAGTIGEVGVFAFYPNKQMTTGEGGMVVTPSAARADLIRSLANQGRDAGSPWLEHRHLGYNYRLDEMSAALGIVQVRRFGEMMAKRRAVAARYDRLLAGDARWRRPQVTPGSQDSPFVYPLFLDPALDRDRVVDRMREKGIACGKYFDPPIHLQPPYRVLGYGPGDFPAAEQAARTSVCLPFFNNLRPEEQEEIVAAFRESVVA